MKKSSSVLPVILEILGLVVVLVVAAVAVLMLQHKDTVIIDGPAMSPTLKSGQKVSLTKYGDGQIPQRGDIVLYSSTKANTKNSMLIHRVIGVPGDHIVISNGAVIITNSQYPSGFNPDNNYLSNDIQTSGQQDLTLKSGEYYVLGDNRSNSLDSRIFGPVLQSQIISKVNQ